MKKISAIAAVFLAAGIATQSLAAYPTSGGKYGGVGMDFQQIEGDNANNSANPEDLFTVDGMDFVLLDTDETGNYFVTTASHMGKYKFYQYVGTEFADDIILRQKSGDDVTDNFDENSIPVKYDEWKFSTTNEKSIGYWLNHEFLDNGYTYAGNKYELPDAIKNKLLDREWEVEGTDIVQPNNIESVLGESGMDLSDLDEIKSHCSYPSYKVSGKISMLSYSEYLQYYDKLGFDFNGSPTPDYMDSFMFRTNYVGLNAANRDGVYTLSIIRGPVTVQNNYAANKLITSGRFVNWSVGAIYYIRPVFWLAEDMFGTVKVENPGENVKKILRMLDYSKLRDLGYTDAEIAEIGVERPVFGFYPEHPQTASRQWDGRNVNTGVGYDKTADESRIFKVGDREFILLDKDDDGNYFVSANEQYGLHAFTTANGYDPKSTDNTPWRFDYENEDSIAAWLDGEFFENGNGDYKLPDELKQYIIEHEWDVEADYPFKTSEVDGAGQEESEETDAWIKSKIEAASPYKTTGKISLMSWTEYQVYKNIIGKPSNDVPTTWQGVLMRTPQSRARINNGALDYGANVMQYVAPTGNSNIIYGTVDPSALPYRVRPVFWLDKDFFANVNIGLTIDETGAAVGAGDVVLSQVAECDYNALKNIYSDDVLEALGVTGFQVKDVKIVDGNGEEIQTAAGVSSVTGKATAVNNTDEAVPIAVIVAAYGEENELLSVSFNESEAGPGVTEIEENLSNIDAERVETIKLFVWDSLEALNPYAMKTIN